jgi:hypothetical protein
VEGITNRVEIFVYICAVKGALHHTVTLLLTICILLSSVGVALSEQLCFMTGLKDVTLVNQEDKCCEKPEKQTSKVDSCCKVDVSYEKLEPISSLKHFHVQLLGYLAEKVKLISIYASFTRANDDHLFTYTDSSPPLYGRSLLTRIQILLI